MALALALAFGFFRPDGEPTLTANANAILIFNF